MYQRLKPLDIDIDIDIEIYAPFGTPKTPLKTELFEKVVEVDFSEKGSSTEQEIFDYILNWKKIRG